MNTPKRPLQEYNVFIWERREDETDYAWDAFQLYRNCDIRPRPSLSEWVKLHAQNKYELRTVYSWSARKDWVKRCRAYDVANQNTIETPVIKRQEKVLQEEFNDYNSMRTIWLRAYSKVEEMLLITSKEADISKVTTQLKNLADARVKIQTFARSSAKLPRNYSVNRQIQDDDDVADDEEVMLDFDRGAITVKRE